MKNEFKILYVLAILFPTLLGYLIWDIKGDIYELSGNIRVAQYMSRQGQLVFPFSILYVERLIENEYLDKKMGEDGPVVIFGQRNPDLPSFSLFLKILGQDPEAMKSLFSKIESQFQEKSREVIDNLRVHRQDQLSSIKKSIQTIESIGEQKPSTLKQGEEFMNIYNHLNELKDKKEFLEVSLDPQVFFNFSRLDDPVIKKKRSKTSFTLSVIAGVLFLITFLIYLLVKIEKSKVKA